ncbi:MAG: adenine deaminase, partial [Verrucomicrobia bacterium]|nr:adenine deaminase [Verrucomicrobiota bacterium]
AVVAGVNPIEAWSMGSLHAAVLHGMDGEIGVIAPGRRADLVLLNDDFEVQNTWYGGELVVEDRKITAILDKALSKRFQYPKAAYNTVKVARRSGLLPGLPAQKVVANVLGVSAKAGSVVHRSLALARSFRWPDLLAKHELCFVTVLARQGRGGRIGHGLLQGFGLGNGAVASSACRDVCSNIVAGSNEADMWLALTTVKEMAGGMCVVRAGRVLARLALPVGGILSDQRASDVVHQRAEFSRAWLEVGCTLSCEDFNRLTSRTQSEIRLTCDGLNLLPGLDCVPLFEAKTDAIV